MNAAIVRAKADPDDSDASFSFALRMLRRRQLERSDVRKLLAAISERREARRG